MREAECGRNSRLRCASVSTGALGKQFAAIRSVEWNFAGQHLGAEGVAVIAQLLVGADSLRRLKCAALAVCCVPCVSVSLLCASQSW